MDARLCPVPVPPRLIVPALVPLLLLLPGCAGTGDPGSSVGPASSGEPATSASGAPAAEGSGTSGASGTAGGAAQFGGDLGRQTAEPSAGAQVTVRDVRLGAHEGFDRVVFEVGGEGTPGWSVQYVDEPSDPGSGAAVEVAGDAVLQVELTGAGYPFDTGVEEYAPAGPLTAAGTGAVTEVVFRSTYEGVTTAFIGTRDETPFRAYLLEDPVRVVVEIAHPS